MSARKRGDAVAAGDGQLEQALAWLERHATKKTLEGMDRFGIPRTHAIGVTVADIRRCAKVFGRSHELAGALWDTGVYEARLLAAFVDEPERVTLRQMNGWASDFDNWAVCDTVCFALFDRAPHRWSRVEAWAGAKGEFKKRGAFALLWGMCVHDREAPAEAFVACLPLIEKASTDERLYVKKGVDMALRGLAKKRGPEIKKAVRHLALRLAESEDRTQAWIGRNALKELGRFPVGSKRSR